MFAFIVLKERIFSWYHVNVIRLSNEISLYIDSWRNQEDSIEGKIEPPFARLDGAPITLRATITCPDLQNGDV